MRRRLPALFAIALGGAALDVAVKSLVFATHPYGRSWPVVPGLYWIECSTGRGGAWTLVWLAAGSALVVSVARARSPRPLEQAAAGLLLAGILGNLWDRLTLGAVRDFIRLPGLPLFNPADALSAAGAVLLALIWIFHERRPLGEAGTPGAGQPPDGGLGDVGRDHAPRP